MQINATAAIPCGNKPNRQRKQWTCESSKQAHQQLLGLQELEHRASVQPAGKHGRHVSSRYPVAGSPPRWCRKAPRNGPRVPWFPFEFRQMVSRKQLDGVPSERILLLDHDRKISLTNRPGCRKSSRHPNGHSSYQDNSPPSSDEHALSDRSEISRRQSTRIQDDDWRNEGHQSI